MWVFSHHLEVIDKGVTVEILQHGDPNLFGIFVLIFKSENLTTYESILGKVKPDFILYLVDWSNMIFSIDCFFYIFINRDWSEKTSFSSIF